MSRGHRQVDHTADLALEIWAPTEAELWEEAGTALISILTEGEVLPTHDSRAVRLETVDKEDRLVGWMNEVLYWATVQGFLLTKADLHRDGEAIVGHAHGCVGGQAYLKAELKSATYHDIVVEQIDGDWRARVVVDV